METITVRHPSAKESDFKGGGSRKGRTVSATQAKEREVRGRPLSPKGEEFRQRLVGAQARSQRPKNSRHGYAT